MTCRLWRRRSFARLRSSKRGIELRTCAAADGAQLTAFQVVPDPFDWIEIRRIARQVLEMDPLGGPTGQKVFDWLAAMDGGSIPDNEEPARELAQQDAQKPHHIAAVIGLRWRWHHQALVGGEGCDRRAMIACQGNPQDRGLPVPRPSADVMGKQVKPRLINPHDHSLLVVGFFSRVVKSA